MKESRIALVLGVVAGGMLLGCVEQPAEEPTGGSGSAGGGEPVESDCPTSASECPDECGELSVSPIVETGEQRCLGEIVVVGCFAPSEEPFPDYVGCALSPEEDYLAVGDSEITSHLAWEQGYRDCRIELEEWGSIPSCAE